MSATLIGVTQTSNAGHPKPPGAHHFDSSSSTHLQCQRINASQPTRSKPYCTNRREEEGLLWLFITSRAIHKRGVDSVREDNKFTSSTPCSIHTIKRWWPLRVAQSTNRLDRVGWLAGINSLDIAGVLMNWNRSDMHLAAWDVRCCSFESLL